MRKAKEFEKAAKALLKLQQKRWEESPLKDTPRLSAVSKLELKQLCDTYKKELQI